MLLVKVFTCVASARASGCAGFPSDGGLGLGGQGTGLLGLSSSHKGADGSELAVHLVTIIREAGCRQRKIVVGKEETRDVGLVCEEVKQRQNHTLSFCGCLLYIH